MATAGEVIGGFINYRVALRAGRAGIEKELEQKRFQQAHRFFERMGFWSVFIGAIAPPPVPTSAFIMVAGALEYPWKRFLLALSFARLIRFFVITWMASRYGRQIFDFFGNITNRLCGLWWELRWRAQSAGCCITCEGDGASRRGRTASHKIK